MKLELLSDNLVQIIERCLGSEDLVKLLYYNTSTNPLSSPAFDRNIIAPFGSSERISPLPFDIKFKGEERSQLQVYYPEVDFINNNVVEDIIVCFDIVVHRRLWLCTQDNKRLVRPYRVASEITRLFDGTIPNTNSTVGKLDFVNLIHVPVNEEFNAIRLIAKMKVF